jgi:hypothetical protein
LRKPWTGNHSGVSKQLKRRCDSTEEGNWDLAGNNTPMFFVRD